MYDKVKVMPSPPEWKSETITLLDMPTKPQTFYYCDLVACAHYLFEQSDLEANMDYVPTEVFDDLNDQVYHEMCTGHEWHKQQVCEDPSPSPKKTDLAALITGPTKDWNYDSQHHSSI